MEAAEEGGAEPGAAAAAMMTGGTEYPRLVGEVMRYAAEAVRRCRPDGAADDGRADGLLDVLALCIAEVAARDPAASGLHAAVTLARLCPVRAAELLRRVPRAVRTHPRFVAMALATVAARSPRADLAPLIRAAA
jgi:hypothetical protein